MGLTSKDDSVKELQDVAPIEICDSLCFLFAELLSSVKHLWQPMRSGATRAKKGVSRLCFSQR